MRLVVSLFLAGFPVWLAVAATGSEPPTRLEAFRVEGTNWQYGRFGEIEVLAQTSRALSRRVVRSLVRGTAIFPSFMLPDHHWPTKLILLDGEQTQEGRPAPMTVEPANLRYWGPGDVITGQGVENLSDERCHAMAINYSGQQPFEVLGARGRYLLRRQQPRFPDWVIEGLLGEAGCFVRVIGIPHSESVRLPKVSWPDPAVEPGVYPEEAIALPAFEVMFDPARNAATMADGEAKKFKFQAAVFARWSLYGPVTNGRNRNGYWVFAELARRQGVSEALFRECYGMDWAQACAEMRAYLKPRNLGIIEVRMPHVMRDVPEVHAMEFREATPEQVRRILGEFNRLWALQPKSDVRLKN